MIRELPTKAENPNGLHTRYRVSKIEGEVDDRAVYFVLRVDPDGSDPDWTRRCRNAVAGLALGILSTKDHPMTQWATEAYKLCQLLGAEAARPFRDDAGSTWGWRTS